MTTLCSDLRFSHSPWINKFLMAIRHGLRGNAPGVVQGRVDHQPVIKWIKIDKASDHGASCQGTCKRKMYSLMVVYLSIISAVFLYCFTTFAKKNTTLQSLQLYLQLLSPEAPFSPSPRASRRDGGWPLRQRQRSFESTPEKVQNTPQR